MIRKEINQFNTDIFKEFNNKWALLTAGDLEDRNSMTVSWGFMGTLWNKNVVAVFVRPTRHTFDLMEKYPRFTLSFLDEKYKPQMTFMGRNSGRDCDKYKETGLTPIYDNDSFVSYIKESKYVMKCKTLYADFLKPDFFKDKELLNHYNDDYHKVYIAEVTSLLIDENEI